MDTLINAFWVYPAGWIGIALAFPVMIWGTYRAWPLKCPDCGKKKMNRTELEFLKSCHPCYRYRIFGPGNGVRTFVLETTTTMREVPNAEQEKA